MNARLSSLSAALGYCFRDENLLREALTHRSASGSSNERLEFLGDAILNFIVADALFAAHPGASEGELSRQRASLVKGENLAVLARALSLGEHLHLGQGELKSGGYRRASIIADALEAVLGALYLDSDLETCRGVILRLLGPQLRELPAAAELKDPKTRLQEYLQARQRPLPVYSVTQISGEAHAQRFTVECRLEDLCTVAVATSRRRAEQAAARQALETLAHE